MNKIVAVILFALLSQSCEEKQQPKQVVAEEKPEQIEEFEDTTQTDITAKFVDANFLKEVRKAINKPTGPIYNTDVARVTELSIGDSSIASLAGIEYFTNLEDLFCAKERLTAINISKNKKLKSLWCSDNRLTTIDVSKNTELKKLWIFNNQLTGLDVSKNLNLEELIFFNNQLTSIDVSKNTNLRVLDLSNNQLTSIDLSKNTHLRVLNCSNNLMPSELSIKGFKGKWDGEIFIFSPQRRLL